MPILPHYPSTLAQLPHLVPPLLWQILRGSPARLSSVGARLFENTSPSPRVMGTELIPCETPFVAIFNHYESSRAAAWWGPLLMSRVIAAERTREPKQVRWVMAREWWYPRGLGRAFKQPLTHALFARLAQVYGLVLVPPILEGHTTRGQGAVAVRRALTLTRGEHPALVGIAPEGRTGPNAALTEPPPGAGLFLLLLTHNALPCLPVGWYEDEQNTINIRFGAPFEINSSRAHDRAARDRAAVTEAMRALAKILPEKFRGAYAAPLDR